MNDDFMVNDEGVGCDFEKREVHTQDEAREYAIEWQKWVAEQNLSYGELVEWSAIFEELADKFDLREEFIENAII